MARLIKNRTVWNVSDARFRLVVQETLDDLAESLDGNLYLEDALAGEVKELALLSGDIPGTLIPSFAGEPSSIVILEQVNTETGVHTENAAITWTYANGEVTITSLGGLDATETSTVRLLVLKRR